jgi:hypothetical protein
MNMGIVTQAVAEFIASQKKVWKHDRRQSIGASEIGQCARKIFCMKFEDDPDIAVPRDPDAHDSWGARERGNLIEKHLLVPAMRAKYSHLAMFMGEEQQTFFDGYLSATPDCLLRLNGELLNSTAVYLLIDFKTIDPRTNLTEAKPEHVYQVQVQMGIFNSLGEFPCSQAVVSYTDASFFSETEEFEVKFDPDYYAAAQKRAHDILTAESMRDIAPEGWIAGGQECKYCPFSMACGAARKDVPDGDGIADPQFVAEIAELAHKYKFMQSTVDMSEKQVRELQHEIKSRLQDKKLRRVVGDGVSVSWSSIKGREITDIKGLREAAQSVGIDLDLYTSVADPGDRLTVTVK